MKSPIFTQKVFKRGNRVLVRVTKSFPVLLKPKPEPKTVVCPRCDGSYNVKTDSEFPRCLTCNGLGRIPAVEYPFPVGD